MTQPTSETYMNGPMVWPDGQPLGAQAQAVLQLDRAGVAYTVWLSPESLQTVWGTLVHADATRPNLVDKLEQTRPTLRNDRGISSRQRIDYAFTRDAIGKIQLEVGMSLNGMSGHQLLLWKETVALLLTTNGARTLGMKIDAMSNYITVTAGEWL